MTLKLGPHIRANNSDHGIDSRLFEVDWPVMTWLDNGSEWGRLYAYHTAHPRTAILGRIPAIEDYYKPRVAVADPGATGTSVADMIINMGAPHFVYWRTDELNNEIAWSAAFNLAVMKRLIPAGYCWCGPMFAEGNPRVSRFDGMSDWPAFRPMFEYMNAHADQTLAVVNTYRTGTTELDDAAHLLRFEELITWLDNWALSNVKIAFGEIGVEVPLLNTKPNDTWLFEHAKDINRLLNKYPRVIGGAWYDFSSIAGLYSAYGSGFLNPFIDWAKGELAGQPTLPPAPTPVPPPTVPTMRVNVGAGSTLNLRSAPVVDSKNVIGSLGMNTSVNIIRTQGGFARVMIGEAEVGWASMAYLI